MQQSLYELLSGVNQDIEIVTCRFCGHSTSNDVETCPHCHKFLKFPTILQYGKKLPIGVLVGDKLIKEFDVKKVDFRTEMQISEAWKQYVASAKRNQITSLQYVLNVLAHTVTSIAGYDFLQMPIGKRRVILNKLYDGDPWYMYAFVRLATVGEFIDLTKIECFHCGKIIESFTVDLNTLEVATIEDYQGLVRTVILEDGFTFLGRENCKKIKIQPPTIVSMLNAAGKNKFEQQLEQICEAVIDIEGMGDKSVMAPDDLERLTKTDRDLLYDSIDQHSCGPKWTVEVDNCECGKKFTVIIPVGYDDFFRKSFRYDRGRIF